MFTHRSLTVWVMALLAAGAARAQPPKAGAEAKDLPRITVLATGGAIAGKSERQLGRRIYVRSGVREGSD